MKQLSVSIGLMAGRKACIDGDWGDADNVLMSAGLAEFTTQGWMVIKDDKIAQAHAVLRMNGFKVRSRWEK